MEVAVERQVSIDPANSDNYIKVLEDISKEREELDKPNRSLRVRTSRAKTVQDRKYKQGEQKVKNLT